MPGNTGSMHSLGPNDSASAGLYRGWVAHELASLGEKQQIPVIVGGTGLWVDALLNGFSRAPAHDPAIGAALRQRWQNGESKVLYARLQICDPATAARLHANDCARITRALAVFETTGKRMSDLNMEPTEGPIPGSAFFTVLVLPDRDTTNAAIAKRIRALQPAAIRKEFDALDIPGTTELAELAELQESPDHDTPGMNLPPHDDPIVTNRKSGIARAIGYHAWLAWYQGRMNIDTTREEAFVATRQYGKRQRTWFRRYRDRASFHLPEHAHDRNAPVQGNDVQGSDVKRSDEKKSDLVLREFTRWLA